MSFKPDIRTGFRDEIARPRRGGIGTAHDPIHAIERCGADENAVSMSDSGDDRGLTASPGCIEKIRSAGAQGVSTVRTIPPSDLFIVDPHSPTGEEGS